jgi:hypothetical protein
VSRRRLTRRSQKAQRHAAAHPAARPAELVREATRVERLAYTRTQAAAALGISRSTFDRRLLPLIETLDMPWGTQLIPIDELERVLAEHRRAARLRDTPRPPRGRRPTISPDVLERIRAEHAAGRSLGEIARGLAADNVPTAHGGAQWWPSTVRSIVRRSARADDDRDRR